jgi:hypothetical protein
LGLKYSGMHPAYHTVAFEGELTPQHALLIEVQPLDNHLVLDFSGSDIETGPTMAALTQALRCRLIRGGHTTLEGPQQLLVHNLYRTHCYPHPLLVVNNLREDEAYG